MKIQNRFPTLPLFIFCILIFAAAYAYIGSVRDINLTLNIASFTCLIFFSVKELAGGAVAGIQKILYNITAQFLFAFSLVTAFSFVAVTAGDWNSHIALLQPSSLIGSFENHHWFWSWWWNIILLNIFKHIGVNTPESRRICAAFLKRVVGVIIVLAFIVLLLDIQMYVSLNTHLMLGGSLLVSYMLYKMIVSPFSESDEFKYFLALLFGIGFGVFIEGSIMFIKDFPGQSSIFLHQ